MDSESDDNNAMAEAMGFSSFGAHPAKKRRYNPHSDSSILPSKPVSAAHSKPSASGANSAPLGTRSAPAASNNDEISLDDDEDAEQQGRAELAGPPATLPQRPAVAAPGAAIGDEQQTTQSKPQGHGQGRGGRGQFNPLWYENYYDPTSNANPWDRLEKKLSIQPRDPWPPRKSITPSSSTSTPVRLGRGNAHQRTNISPAESQISKEAHAEATVTTT
jgi:hypothetical protein